LTTDQCTSFISGQIREFVDSYKIKLLNSSSNYAQANGQAESSNKTLIKLIKKKMEENPTRWHEVLSEALWVHRISRHNVIKVTHFELVYGQEVVLPVEVNLGAYRLAKQNDLDAIVYHNLMMDNNDEITDKRMKALKEIEKDKARVARAYNKKVRPKSFQVGELVWKTILPLGTKDIKFGKWSPSWEGQYKIVKVIAENSYMMESLQGTRLSRALNDRYLKKYYPSVWQDAWVIITSVFIRNHCVVVKCLVVCMFLKHCNSLKIVRNMLMTDLSRPGAARGGWSDRPRRAVRPPDPINYGKV
jgi:hypothetical protein